MIYGIFLYNIDYHIGRFFLDYSKKTNKRNVCLLMTSQNMIKNVLPLLSPFLNNHNFAELNLQWIKIV